MINRFINKFISRFILHCVKRNNIHLKTIRDEAEKIAKEVCVKCIDSHRDRFIILTKDLCILSKQVREEALQLQRNGTIMGEQLIEYFRMKEEFIQLRNDIKEAKFKLEEENATQKR
jgi:hypothetical protein